ncbi:ErpL protein [Borreliella lusitaniae]|uniref:ErpL protein n=1 Tax=Borreliella lusitaniae TaxID=100177 RepID=UPI003C729AD4
MNKKMFIICVVLVLISSCKNDESKEEGSLANILDDIGLEVEKLVQADGAQEQARNKDGGAIAGAAGGGAAGVAGGAGAGVVPEGGAAGEDIKKKIEDLRKKIEKADLKKTSLGIYREYEEEVKKLKKDNGNGDELKKLEDSLKTKKDARKKDLEESKKKFEEFKRKVASATGQTYGGQAKNRGQIGQQALQQAQKLGLRIDTSKNSSDTNALVSQVIDGALEKIAEELK